MGPGALSPVFALLIDGTTVEIRAPAPSDHDAVRAFFARLGPENVYRRFLGALKDPGRLIADALAPADGVRVPGHDGLLALREGEILGVAEWVATGVPGEAEVAFAVGDGLHRLGVATLLAEHLLDAARRGGTRLLVAYTQLDNYAMLGVFARLGVPVTRAVEDGLAVLRMPLETDQDTRLAYLDATEARERRAGAASVRHVLRPASVAVMGGPDDVVARTILAHVREGGFTGRLYEIGSDAGLAGLPEAPELVVLTGPPARAVASAAACGRRGVRALIAVATGFDAVTGPALLAACRRHGMRLVGPDSLGVAATDPEIRLDATFGARRPEPGVAGLVVQSGGVGIALLEHLSRLGVGVSGFASVGQKYDVSANDLLMYWERDPATRLCLLYVNSFGNPRKFSRTARRVARTMPLLTVDAGRTAAGRRAGGTRVAAAVPRRALFHRAGIIATRSLGELIAAAALLATQPLPAGGRVGILSNVGGPAGLAADACIEAGLTVPELDEADRAALAALLPAGAAVANPVDATTAVSLPALRAAARRLADCACVDAVIVLLAPTALRDLRPLLTDPAWTAKPVAAVLVAQPESVTLLGAGPARRIPAYADPAEAATALGYAHRYAAWRERDTGEPPELPDVDRDSAAGLVAAYLSDHPDGGRLDPAGSAALLGCYRVPLLPGRVVHSPDEAAEAPATPGGPAVLRALLTAGTGPDAPGRVLSNLRDPAALRSGYRLLAARFGDRLAGVVVQPMLDAGVEFPVNVVHDEVFGPLLLAGTPALAAWLTPLTEADAAELADSLTAAPSGPLRGVVDTAGLADLLLRVSRLADDLPQVASLALDPVVVCAHGCVAVDVRVDLTPRHDSDPYLRHLTDRLPAHR